MTRKIIGLSGFKRTGKDTVAGYLESHHDMLPFAFADNVKQTAMTMFGLTYDQAFGNYGFNREDILPQWSMSVRHILQKVGTECGRDIFGYDIWIKRLQVDINNYPSSDYLVSDVRFENEAAWIKSSGGIIIDIIRPGCESDGHRSEAGVANYDYQIINSGTLEDLYGRVDEIVEHHYGKG